MRSHALPRRGEHTESRTGHVVEVRPEADSTPPSVSPASLTGSRVLASRVPGASFSERGATELYLRELSSSHPLTREGEVEIGRRIEAGERDVIEAWVKSPVALRELGLMSDDLEAGLIGIRDLVLVGSLDDAAFGTSSTRLTGLLRVARALSMSNRARSAAALGDLITGLAEVRLDPLVVERIDRSLRAAADEGSPADRASIEATFAAMARGRRASARAKADLVHANLRLAVTIARQYQRFDVPLLDLVQEGNIGLMRAADTFEYRRGHRFSTYAGWWIKQSVRRALLRQGKPIRMPAHLVAIRSQVLRARRELLQDRGREPSPEEIAERAGLPLDKVRVISELSLEPLSLDAPVGEEGDTRFGDLLAGEEPRADDVIAKRRLVEQTRDLLASLDPREREVLRRRYGLDGDEDETLEEIGQSFSLTRERIRQIEAKALAKLRPRSRQRELGSYFER